MSDLIQSSVKCKNCGSDLWDVIGNEASCANCATKRPYHRRNGNSGQMTKSQEKQLDYIKRWFRQYFRKDNLAKYEITYQDETGLVYLSVETTDHPLTMDGVFLSIGRRGGIKIHTTYGLSKVHDEQFYAKFLGGKVGW